MTSFASPLFAPRHSTAKSSRFSPPVARAAFAAVVALAAVAGFAATHRAETAQAVSIAGLDLVRLMRFMALIKGMMAAAVAAGVLWRLGAGIGATRLLAYSVTGAFMAGGLGLIWDMVHVGAGAVLLHTGLIGTGVLLWRDPVTAGRLAEAVSMRRRSAGSPTSTAEEYSKRG